jgi:hypothetical protein
MRKPLSDSLAFLLAALLLTLQLAGSSPALHGFLHGENGASSECCDHTPAGGESSDSEACDDGCIVLTIAGGVTLAPAVSLEGDVPRLISVCLETGTLDVFEQFRTAAAARAPPGL